MADAYPKDFPFTVITIMLPWLPANADLHIDFTNGNYFFNNQLHELSDLTPVAAGGYELNYNLGISGTATVVIDFEDIQSAPPSGCLFSWTTGYPDGQRVEFVVDDGPFDKTVAVYLPIAPSGADYQAIPLVSKDGEDTEAGYYVGNGRRRVVVKLKSGQLVKVMPDNGDLRIGNKTAATLLAPSKLGFACRAWSVGDPDNQFLGGTLHSVTVYNDDLSDADINELGKASSVHLIGDSFLNLYNIFSKLVDLTSPNYVGYSQDGVGATTLTEQAVRFAANNSKWHDSTLVICDFGLDTDAATSIAAIESMLSSLTHTRWIYLQPSPIEATGTGGRDTWDSRVSAISEFCGSHYIPTLAEAYSRGDDSPEDNLEISQGLWPLSLKNSVSDFHPSALGQQMIAEIINSALVERGWLPASQVHADDFDNYTDEENYTNLENYED